MITGKIFLVLTAISATFAYPLQQLYTSGGTLIPGGNTVNYATTFTPINSMSVTGQVQPQYQYVLQSQQAPAHSAQSIGVYPQMLYSTGTPTSAYSTNGNQHTVQTVPNGGQLATTRYPPHRGGSQTVQLPCTLQIQTPVPLVLPPGASQVATQPYLPQEIPASYIDHSTPTVPVLRPPTEYNLSENIAPTTSSTVVRSPNVYVVDSQVTPVAAVTENVETTKSRSSEESQTQDGNDVKMFDSKSLSLARHGLPVAYAVMPQLGSTSSIGPVAYSPSTSNRGGNNDSRSTRNKNPFFSVNKRKHFEFYQYF